MKNKNNDCVNTQGWWGRREWWMRMWKVKRCELECRLCNWKECASDQICCFPLGECTELRIWRDSEVLVEVDFKWKSLKHYVFLFELNG